jgi:hypothetical protein
MSIGNLGAAIGLANTNKIPCIGAYAQGVTPPPGWSASDSYMGVNGSVYYNRNVLDEDYTASGGITVNGNSGAATGKLARWVSNTASLTVGADQTIAVSAGGVATAGTAAAYKTPFAVSAVIPANSFFWVFTV